MKKIMIAMFLISLFIIPKQSFALSCVEPSPPDVAYDEYDAVIIGTVQQIKENNGEKILTLKVDKSFKGVDHKVITVKEDITWGKSQLNLDYLYFLNQEGENWNHSPCSPTTNNTSAADKFFAGKEEIALQDVVISDSENKLQHVIVFIVVILTIGMAVFLIRKRKKNDRFGGGQ